MLVIVQTGHHGVHVCSQCRLNVVLAFNLSWATSTIGTTCSFSCIVLEDKKTHGVCSNHISEVGLQCASPEEVLSISSSVEVVKFEVDPFTISFVS